MTDVEKLTQHYEPDEKRPFGNSDIEMNIAEILKWDIFIDSDNEPHLTTEQFEEAQRLHLLVKESFNLKAGINSSPKITYKTIGNGYYIIKH